MRKYIFIGVGGMTGALLRFLMKKIPIPFPIEWFPVNTLIINLIGCFALGFILTLALDILDFDPDIRLGIATGFIGAYTTFSTVCKEIVNLIFAGHYFSAFLYLILSCGLGFLCVYLGTMLARKFIKFWMAFRIKKGEESE